VKAKFSAVPPPLSEELRAVEADHPGWHCWCGDTGRCHATTPRCAYPDGSGTTVEAPTPVLLHHAIAEVVHGWAVSGGIA
jgi:hypothetical protein